MFGSGDSVSSDAAIWKKNDRGVKTLFVSSSQKSVFQTGTGITPATKAQASMLIKITNFDSWKEHVSEEDKQLAPSTSIIITDSEGNSENFIFGVNPGANIIDVSLSNNLASVREKIIQKAL